MSKELVSAIVINDGAVMFVSLLNGSGQRALSSGNNLADQAPAEYFGKLRMRDSTHKNLHAFHIGLRLQKQPPLLGSKRHESVFTIMQGFSSLSFSISRF
jgi:hypothetical protein